MRQLLIAAKTPQLGNPHNPANNRRANRGMFATFPQFREVLPKTYAPHPVWSASTTREMPWKPLDKGQKRAISRAARAFLANKQLTAKNRARSVLGASAFIVFETLLWGFHNCATGRLDPSYETIAKQTGQSRATVARALAHLKALGLIHWVRRCEAVIEKGVCKLVQLTNAYSVSAVSMWRGFTEAPRTVRVVLAHEYGAAPVMPTIEETVATAGATGDSRALAAALELDPAMSRIAAALRRVCCS